MAIFLNGIKKGVIVMSWALEADVDLVKSEEAVDLAMTFLSVFGESVQRLRLEAVEGGWGMDGVTISKDTFEGLAGVSPALSEYCKGLLINRNRRVEIDIGLAVEVYDQAWPQPAIRIFGPEHLAMSIRRMPDAALTFGNRQAYRGNTRLSSGSLLTEQFVIDALKSVCHAISPKSVFLHCEQMVSFPIDYHFVYHRSLEGFAEDVAEIVRLSLHGGEGYRDGRRSYPAAVSDVKGEAMMFGRRRGEWLSMVKRFLDAKCSRLEKAGMPTTFSFEFMTDVLKQSADVGFFYTDDGLGVYGLPLLSGYCEGFYFGIMEKLSPVTNIGKDGPNIHRDVADESE